MSTSAKAIKPKRPLSGYNLFYRYKRLKVVEATSRRDIKNEDDHRTRAVMHGVLTALPGLEDVPPVFPLFDLPPARLEEFRAANIRKAMEGKLFPNEHARKRVHCKVHGMGFVEMGRVMRQMWAQADKLTKDVFCELADVGRVRYRRLAAEYRLGGERPENVSSTTPDYEVHKSAETSALKSEEVAPADSFPATNKSPVPSFPATLAAASAVDPMTTEATAKAKASETPPIPQQAGSSSEPMLEELSAWMTSSESKKGSRPSCGRRVSLDPYTLVPSEGQSYGRSHLSEPLAVTSMTNPTANVASAATEKSFRPRHQRPASTAARLALCDDSLFEPLPFEGTPKTSSGQGRRVSTDVAPQQNWRAMMGKGSWAPETNSGHGRRMSTDVSPMFTGSMGAPSAVATGNGGASSHFANASLGGSKTNPKLQQIVLGNTLKNLNDRIIQNRSSLPSGMRVFPNGGTAPRAQPQPEIMTSSGPSILSSHNGPKKREASARGSAEFNYEPDEDFIKLINDLDKVIDDHGIAVGATREKADRTTGIAEGAYSSPSSLFGKPAFDMTGRDFGDKPVSRGQTVPMPAGIRLKNQGARMA